MAVHGAGNIVQQSTALLLTENKVKAPIPSRSHVISLINPFMNRANRMLRKQAVDNLALRMFH